jgi:predicted permease
LLVLLACANAANLMLGWHIRRRSDLAIRNALGVGRRRLLRELLIEAAALSLGACLLGLALGAAFASIFRTSRLLSYLPLLEGLTLDWRVAAFCALLSALTIALFALVPALIASRADIRAAIGASGSTPRHTSRIRLALVGAQIALSFMLLVAAALLAQTVHRLQSLDFGFSPDAVLGFTFRPARAGHDDAATAAAIKALHDRLSAAPGIGGVALAFSSPFGSRLGSVLRLPEEDAGQALRISSYDVTGEYFQVLGIPVLRGRTFSAAESFASRAEGSPIILNAALARRLFGSAPDVGRTILTQRRTARGLVWQPRTVIGVVGNALGPDVREEFMPFAYEPFGRSRISTVLMRPQVPFDRAAALAREAARAAAPGVPVDDIAPLRLEADERIAQERVLSRLSLVVGALAALLALAGLYAAVAQFVGERTREIAIRTAIGAGSAAIARTILSPVARTAVAGLIAGAALAGPLSGLLAAYLFGISPRDPRTIAAAGAGLMAAALLAAWPAVRRATRVDPASALRSE